MLKPLGVGVSDYLDVLSHSVFETPLTSAIDAPAELRQLQPCSPLYEDDAQPDEPCPVLDLATIPKRMSQNVHYYTRRAQREGAVSWEESNLLEALIDLHTASWQQRGGAGVFGDARVQAFHRAAVPTLSEAGVLWMYGLRLNSRVIGVWYGFLHRRTLYFLSRRLFSRPSTP